MTSQAIEGACAFAWRNHLLLHSDISENDRRRSALYRYVTNLCDSGEYDFEQRLENSYGFKGPQSRPAPKVAILDRANPPQPRPARRIDSEDRFVPAHGNVAWRSTTRCGDYLCYCGLPPMLSGLPCASDVT